MNAPPGEIRLCGAGVKILVVMFLLSLACGFGAGWCFRDNLNAQQVDTMLSESFHRGYKAAQDEGWTDLFAKQDELRELQRQNAQLLIQIGKAATHYNMP